MGNLLKVYRGKGGQLTNSQEWIYIYIYIYIYIDISLSPADNESVQAAFVQGPRLPTPDLTVWPGSLHRSPGDRVP